MGKHRLNKTNNTTALNKDVFKNILISNQTKEICDGKLIKDFFALEQEELERDECDNYRFVIEIDSDFINSLQNITGSDSLCVLNSERFLNSKLNYDLNSSLIRLIVGVYNSNLGSVNVIVTKDEKNYVDVVTDSISRVFEIPIDKSIDNLNIKLTQSLNTNNDFICWTKNGDIMFTEDINDVIQNDGSINVYNCYYGNVMNKLNNNIYCISETIPPNDINKQTTYHYKIKCDLPIINDDLLLKVKLVGVNDFTSIKIVSETNESEIFMTSNEIYQNVIIEVVNDGNNNMYDLIINTDVIND
jgi:hypothetical protein